MEQIQTVALLLCGHSIPVVTLKATEVESSGARHSVAVENACAWPSLTRDCTVVAILHNKPAHATMEADGEGWASSDGFKWEKRSTDTQHEPQKDRLSRDAGRARNGDLLGLCSDWIDVKQPERPKQSGLRDAVLHSGVLLFTWRTNQAPDGSVLGHPRHHEFPECPDMRQLVAIFALNQKHLFVAKKGGEIPHG